MKRTFLVVMVALLASTNLQADIVTTTTTAPSSNLLLSQTVGGSQYLVDSGRDPGQGQTFNLASDFTLDAITVQIGTDTRGAQNAAEEADALSLNLYDISNGFVLDGTTLLGSFSDATAADFDATTANTTPLFLTFDLDAASTASLGTLTAGTQYAFTVTTSATTDPGFRIERSAAQSYTGGDGIFTGGNNEATLRTTDDAVFFIQGTAVPEPGALSLLALGAIGFVTRRRRV